MRRFCVTLVVLASLAACGPSGKPTAPVIASASVSASTSAIRTPCTKIDARLAATEELHAAGRLLRAAATLKAPASCPEDEPRRRIALAAIEAELFPDEVPTVAIPLAKKQASAHALALGVGSRLAGDHAGALTFFTEAIDLRRPYPAGAALVAAGFEAMALSNPVWMQRYFDRATVAYEKVTGAKMRLGLGQPLFCYGVVSNPVRVAWVPHTEWLAVFCGGDTAIYDAEAGYEIARFSGSRGAVVADLDHDELPALAMTASSAPAWSVDATMTYWSDDGKRVTVVDPNDGTSVTSWRTSDPQALWTITLPSPVALGIFAAAETKLALALEDGKVVVLDATTGKTVRTLAGAKPTIGALSSSSDGKKLTAWSDPGTDLGVPGNDAAITWSLETGKILATSKGRPRATTEDGKLVAVVRDKWLDVRRVAGNALVHAIFVDGYGTEHVAFSPSGKYVAATVKRYEDGGWEPRAYRVADGKLVPTFPDALIYEKETVIFDPQKHPLRLRSTYFDWPIVGPLPVSGTSSMMSGPHPAAVMLDGESLEFALTELQAFADVGTAPDSKQTMYVTDPRGPLKVLDLAVARTRVVCCVGPYRLPLDVCRDRLTE